MISQDNYNSLFEEYRAEARTWPTEVPQRRLFRALQDRCLISYHVIKRELAERFERSAIHDIVGYDS